MISTYNIRFYEKSNGRIPVQDFLYSLEPKLRAKAFHDLELLRNMGGELTEPHVKKMKGRKNQGLYELRIKYSSDIARIFYFTYHNGNCVLLHGFVKKTMLTPERELEKARNYMEDYNRRNNL